MYTQAHTLKHTNIHTCQCTTRTERGTHVRAHKHTTAVCCTLQASELRGELPDFLFSLQIPSFLVGSPNHCVLPRAVMIRAWGDAHLWSCDPSFLSSPSSVSPSTRLSPASRSIFSWVARHRTARRRGPEFMLIFASLNVKQDCLHFRFRGFILHGQSCGYLCSTKSLDWFGA